MAVSLRPAVLAGALAWLLASGAAATATSLGTAGASPVDELLAVCPTSFELAALDADVSVAFEADPTAGTLVCTAVAGSRDLTRLQERVYQALRAMRAIPFSRPFAWTSSSLYDWFVGAIDGIRFRGDIAFSFCCSPAGVINIQTTTLAPGETRWVEPSGSGGLYGLVKLLVHEARHNEGKPHTCGARDDTIAELGAIGVTWYLDVWEALFSGAFLDAGAFPYPEYYREVAVGTAEELAGTFCALPAADLSVAVADGPDPVAAGAEVLYAYTVANAGPAVAPEAYLYVDVPTGARFLRVSASQGSCDAAPAENPAVVGCALGELAAGAAAEVEVAYRVVGPPGSRLSSAGVSAFALGASADADDSDDSARASTDVAAPAGAVCPGTPGAGGRVIVGTARGETLRGTRGDDVICGLGGADRIVGGRGDDLLRGGGGHDVIEGGPGRDRLEGGAGRDRCLPGPPGFGRGDVRIRCEA